MHFGEIEETRAIQVVNLMIVYVSLSCDCKRIVSNPIRYSELTNDLLVVCKVVSHN